MGLGVVPYRCLGGGHLMDQTVIVRGRHAGRTFISDGPLPDAEGLAELVIVRGGLAAELGRSPAKGAITRSLLFLGRVGAPQYSWCNAAGDRNI